MNKINDDVDNYLDNDLNDVLDNDLDNNLDNDLVTTMSIRESYQILANPCES